MPKTKYKYSKDEYQAIKGLKLAIIEVFTVRDSPGMHREAIELITAASEFFEDYRKDIATNALKYRNISDKQAYCLAAGLIEEGVADLEKYICYAEHAED